MKNTLFVLIFLLCANYSYAKTIWVNPANDSVEDGFAKASGYSTLWKAFADMSSGDTIIIADGDWSSGYGGMYISSDPGHCPLDGSVEAYTVIKAETDFGVRLSGIRCLGYSQNYVAYQGIVFDTNSSAYGFNYCKFIRCGFFAEKVTGNICTFSISKGSYNLLEECIAWGGGRYKFLDYLGHHNIFRRCVARHDWYISSEWAGQESNFRGYGCCDSVWQNCISIDSDREEYQTTGSTEDADFWIGDQANAGGNIINGCIVLKGLYMSYYFGGRTGEETMEIYNSVGIGPGLEGANYLTGGIIYGLATVTGRNLLLIDYDRGNQRLISHNKAAGSITIDSCIFRNAGGLYSSDVDYSCYYDIASGDFGSNSINEDPFKNGLLYPVRVEADTLLVAAGTAGGVAGATILKKIGRSGTLYGEDGWDEETDENLWPFPNEDKIKELMSKSVEVDGIDLGSYGFCVKGNKQLNGLDDVTLTSYIWEFFGNKMPFEIYGDDNIKNDLDINRDGMVNIQDVIVCVNIILGVSDGNADVNGDGQINVQDVIFIVNDILR